MINPYTDNDYLLPPPYQLHNMHVLGCWLRGKTLNVRRYVNAHLNQGGTQKFVLLTDLLREAVVDRFPGLAALVPSADNMDYPILLTIHDIGSLTSTAIIDGLSLDKRGFFSYQEIAFWIPLAAFPVDANPGIDLANGVRPPILLYMPLLIADNALAVAGGREILGMPKRYGAILHTQADGTASPSIGTQTERLASGTRLDKVLKDRTISMTTDVLQTFQTTTQAAAKSFLDISFRIPVAGGSNSTIENNWSKLLKFIVQEGIKPLENLSLNPLIRPAFGLISAFLTDLANDVLQTANLKVIARKQFRRGIPDHLNAAYASVNQIGFSTQLIEGETITGMDIHCAPHDFASLSLSDQLGITAQTTSVGFHALINGTLTGSTEEVL